MHLVIDGYGADPELLRDEAAIYQLLDIYPERIGMTKVSAPHVFQYVGTKPEDWGVSGFVIIAESHIAIHTFVERGLVNIDVFSCKAFDARQVIDFFRDQFRLSSVNTFILRRGLEYPGPERDGVPVFEPALSIGGWDPAERDPSPPGAA
ncbi:MAG: S-adenosylmethionine decarboxylase [Dehalococcoidia bacterium]|nr:S-adenosylmethionine decarboxylase [Dehalococcoidia bacterium]